MVLATVGGRLLRFEINNEQLPVMGRAAVGLQALRLRKQEKLVNCVTIGKDDNLLLVTQLGYVKRMPVSALRRGHRGDIGSQALQFTNKSDALAGMIVTPATGEVAVVTNTQRIVHLSVESLALQGKDGKGDRLTQLKPEETISLAISSHQGNDS
jgi:DNA gyrase subunit A